MEKYLSISIKHLRQGQVSKQSSVFSDAPEMLKMFFNCSVIFNCKLLCKNKAFSCLTLQQLQNIHCIIQILYIYINIYKNIEIYISIYIGFYM